MKCHWPDGVCPTPNACEQMGDCAAKERGLIDDRDPRDAEIDRLRGLLRRGFAFSANCEADPEQPQAFREKAIAWQNEVASAIDGTADQPPAALGDELIAWECRNCGELHRQNEDGCSCGWSRERGRATFKSGAAP